MEVEMKMVKSLLLGTTAGLVAVAGAQAADMPVKAAPVQYVKICSLYGDGFYYIPGTDICLKVGGYVRGEYSYNYGPSMATGPFAGTATGAKDRLDGQDFTMRTRAYAWFDSRQQTEYGTLRSYLQIGVNYDSPQNTNTNFNANRAFIQFAGFTVGIAQNWRVDQAWGSAQLMIAAHDASAGYYAANAGSLVGAGGFTAVPCTGLTAGFLGAGAGTLTGSEACGHPADKLGWAAGGGARLNAYGGDYFQFQVNYTQGASRYSANTIPGSFGGVNQWNGASLGYGFFTDGVFSTVTGDVQLTTTIGVNAAYDHL